MRAVRDTRLSAVADILGEPSALRTQRSRSHRRRVPRAHVAGPHEGEIAISLHHPAIGPLALLEWPPSRRSAITAAPIDVLATVPDGTIFLYQARVCLALISPASHSRGQVQSRLDADGLTERDDRLDPAWRPSHILGSGRSRGPGGVPGGGHRLGPNGSVGAFRDRRSFLCEM